MGRGVISTLSCYSILKLTMNVIDWLVDLDAIFSASCNARNLPCVNMLLPTSHLESDVKRLFHQKRDNMPIVQCHLLFFCFLFHLCSDNWVGNMRLLVSPGSDTQRILSQCHNIFSQVVYNPNPNLGTNPNLYKTLMLWRMAVWLETSTDRLKTSWKWVSFPCKSRHFWKRSIVKGLVLINTCTS